jgi:rare lipoprotein A
VFVGDCQPAIRLDSLFDRANPPHFGASRSARALPIRPCHLYRHPIMRRTSNPSNRSVKRRHAPASLWSLALLTACLVIPLGASTAQTSNLADAPPVVEPGVGANPEIVPFAAHFEEVIDPLGPDLQNLDLAVPPTAVDLDTFDPPRGPSILRSLGTGVASYYGRRFHGRLTANGERFDMSAMTAAHKTLPFGSLVRVTNPRNGKSVTVRINDRGPFTRGRTIDLSRAAAREIGLVSRGHGTVEMELLAR